MQRITTKAELTALARKYGLSDWHENDELNITAEHRGTSFDTAGFWPEENGRTMHTVEQYIILKHDGQPIAAVNLAMLFAWATGYGN